jgi:hypothetical protein
MMDLTIANFSEPICQVDVAELLAWLPMATNWIVQQGNSPTRLHDPPLTGPIIAEIAKHFPMAIRAQEIVLSKVLPGQNHGMHVDRQSPYWLTRVHVPLVVNDRAYHVFEEIGEQLFMEVGMAYSFNTEKRHAFSNQGDEARVHLIFDAMRM